MYGWTGVILRVELTEGRITKEDIPHELCLNFLGGEGFGVKWLYDEVPPNLDPFDPQMIFVIATGPLTGTLCPASGRLEIITKSQRTGILGDTNVGGFFAPELKWAGYDAIIIQGKAKNPVYLFIVDDEVEIRDASHLWGKEEKSWVEEKIKEEIADPEVKILDIGIAGEKRVSYAAVFSSSVRAAAMTGVGSIMGAKNLKAIAVRGTRGVRLADPQGFQQAALECHQKVRSGPVYKEFSQLGTLGFLQDAFEAYGYLIVRNFQQTWLPQDVFEPISGATWMKRYKVKDLACFGCPVHCSHYFRVKEGQYAGLKGEGLEYYAHTIFTNNLGVFDPSFAIKCTKLADELGLDIGNTGHALAYAAELYQRGIITRKDADGLELSWGNQEAFLELMKKIALREGFGDILADGLEKASQEIGKGAERYLVTLKGSAATGDLRYGFGFPLAYLTSTRGADHLKGAPMAEMVEGMMPEVDGVLAREIFGIPTMNPESVEGKEKMVRWYENLCAIIDSLGTCKFNSVYQLGLKGGLDFGDYAKMLTQATGIDYDTERLFEIGERIYRLEMAYNAREGLRREDFKVPPRFTEDEIPAGPLKGAKLDLTKINRLLDAYFELRGFDPKTALPKRSGLEEAGLKWAADDLERRGLLAKE